MEPCAHQHLCKYTKQTLQNTAAKNCIKILKMAVTECGLNFSFKHGLKPICIVILILHIS